MGRYTHPHTRQRATTVAAYDGYVLVTPEYDHPFPGVLKNALDRVHAEWNNKAVGLVSYGFDGYGLPSIRQVAASTRALFAVAAFFSLMPKFVRVKTATLWVPVASV